MTMRSSPCEQDKLQRLVDQVEQRQFHREERMSSARAWLVQWLSTPQADLNGRKHASFLEHDDFDLILLGLLVKRQTSREWMRAP